MKTGGSRKRPVEIRPLRIEELPGALELVWDVFSQFDAPEFEPEGIGIFRDFIELDHMRKLVDSRVLTFYGAFAGGKVVGVLGMRGPAHISLLFVDPKVHCRGVARALLEQVIRETPREENRVFTVNSSSYGVPFYKRVGFIPLEPAKEVNGMIITPMQLDLDANQTGILR